MIPHMVVIEEPHLLSSDKNRTDVGGPVLPTMFATCAKRNIKLVISNQLMSNVSPEILGNIGCRIVTRLTNPRCIRIAELSMGLTPEQAAQIPTLERGYAIVQYGDYPSAFLIRIDTLSFSEKPDEAVVQKKAEAFLGEVTWASDGLEQEEAANAAGQPPDPDSLTGDCLRFILRIAEYPEPIEDRCDALGLDRAGEWRLRDLFESKGIIAEEEQTLGKGIKFLRFTAKGLQWAKKHKVKVKRYKSGPLHEYLLRQIEMVIGMLDPRFSFQRHSSIAREYGLQPDSVLHLPGGERIIIEICCNNMAYEARNLIKERHVEGVDMVLAVTPSCRLRHALNRALQKCTVDGDLGPCPAPLMVIDATKCLSDGFDWSAVVHTATEPREEPDGTVP